MRLLRIDFPGRASGARDCLFELILDKGGRDLHAGLSLYQLDGFSSENEVGCHATI